MEKDVIENDPLEHEAEGRSPAVTVTITVPLMSPEDEDLEV
ncbi:MULTISPECIES: hypothetical protein [unclassified Streptomyces]|uniref:Uncharacterized protein n=1 Tax=Streptomyces johnsoniae TaxID=3075532 RepID=A0ABU2S5L8_9ACTN|nr:MULTISPECIES: hypothetical protein [unclassified Streptomyces]MDT0444261.1 hypothetical protein [Streptomyces sp. DSM 41886]ONK14779.1 hypothetical protein STBA_55710 [Streptomyces sp. MP131-18]